MSKVLVIAEHDGRKLSPSTARVGQRSCARAPRPCGLFFCAAATPIRDVGPACRQRACSHALPCSGVRRDGRTRPAALAVAGRAEAPSSVRSSVWRHAQEGAVEERVSTRYGVLTESACMTR